MNLHVAWNAVGTEIAIRYTTNNCPFAPLANDRMKLKNMGMMNSQMVCFQSLFFRMKFLLIKALSYRPNDILIYINVIRQQQQQSMRIVSILLFNMQ